MFKKATIPERLKSAVIIRDRGVCQNCGKKAIIYEWGAVSYPRYRAYERKWGINISFEIGHIIPESQGGATVLENLILLCRFCNRNLGTKTWQPPQDQE